MVHFIHENNTIKLLKNNCLIGYIVYEVITYPHLKEIIFTESRYKKHRYFRKLLNYWEVEMKKLKYKRVYSDIDDFYYAHDFDRAEYYYELKNQYYIKFLNKRGDLI